MGKKKRRCLWVEPDWELGVQYHDNEWGVPVHEDRLLFEMLLLESFQAGISWAIVLKKRESLRKAFDQFDPAVISKYDQNKIDELLTDSGIIRSKAKILAAISNAKIFLDIQKEYGLFSKYIWGFTDGKVIRSEDFIATRTPLADQISSDLKKRGIKFMGPVITYAYLQAVGIVNNHHPHCFRVQDIE